MTGFYEHKLNTERVEYEGKIFKKCSQSQYDSFMNDNEPTCDNAKLFRYMLTVILPNMKKKYHDSIKI